MFLGEKNNRRDFAARSDMGGALHGYQCARSCAPATWGPEARKLTTERVLPVRQSELVKKHSGGRVARLQVRKEVVLP
jgi:hypothetical protein